MEIKLDHISIIKKFPYRVGKSTKSLWLHEIYSMMRFLNVIQRDCCTIFSQTESGIAGQSINRRTAIDGFLNFLVRF